MADDFENANDAIEYLVGLRDDAADPDGSAHAKLKSLITNIDATMTSRLPDVMEYTQAGYSQSLGGTGSVTVCSVSGKGIASISAQSAITNSYDECYAPNNGSCSVTVDGINFTLNFILSASYWIPFDSSFVFVLNGSGTINRGTAIVCLKP